MLLIKGGFFYEERYIEIIKKTIQQDKYSDVLSLIEYSVQLMGKMNINESWLQSNWNDVFIKEYVGYRFIDGLIVPISNDIEMEALSQATENTYGKIEEHICKALRYLSDRQHQDYDNSIKESITAVEEACNEIVGEKLTLGNSLKQLEGKGVVIHPALKAAFGNLYGYLLTQAEYVMPEK